MTFGQGILLHVLHKYNTSKTSGKKPQKLVTLKVNDRNREGLN